MVILEGQDEFTIGYDLGFVEQVAPGIAYVLWLQQAKKLDWLFSLWSL